MDYHQTITDLQTPYSILKPNLLSFLHPTAPFTSFDRIPALRYIDPQQNLYSFLIFYQKVSSEIIILLHKQLLIFEFETSEKLRETLDDGMIFGEGIDEVKKAVEL